MERQYIAENQIIPALNLLSMKFVPEPCRSCLDGPHARLAPSNPG
jgi:hypothetical protein